MVTLEAIVARRENSFLSLVEQTPASLLMVLTVELGTQLIHAWVYVIVDYLRKQKLDQISPHLQPDHEALQKTLDAIMKVARRRVQADALGGLTVEDCENGEKRLQEVMAVAHSFVEEASRRKDDELARYAAKVRGELEEGERPPTPPVRERSQTPHGQRSQAPTPHGQRSQAPTPHGRSKSPAEGGRPRSASPFGGAFGLNPADSGRSVSPASPLGHEDGDEHRSSKPMWKKAWTATKRLGGKAQKGIEKRVA